MKYRMHVEITHRYGIDSCLGMKTYDHIDDVLAAIDVFQSQIGNYKMLTLILADDEEAQITFPQVILDEAVITTRILQKE